MAVRFVENSNEIDMKLYQEFKDDLKVLTNKVLFEKWGVSKYYRFRRWCAEEGIFIENFPKAQYYFFDTHHGKWIVYRKHVYYGSYNSEDEAKARVVELKENGWCKSHLVRNYCKNAQGKYVVRKTIKGKNQYFGTFDSLEDVEWVVSFLRENDWSKEKLSEVLI